MLLYMMYYIYIIIRVSPSPGVRLVHNFSQPAGPAVSYVGNRLRAADGFDQLYTLARMTTQLRERYELLHLC